MIGASACANHGQGAQEPLGISDEGIYSFEKMGWNSDLLLTSDSGPATVRFWLPEDTEQGHPHLYGVRLEFDWHGNPGDVGDVAYLRGRWNGLGFYLFEIERLTTSDEGFHWATTDLVNGHSEGYELGMTFSGASTNFAQLRAVRPGWNDISIFLDLLDASNKDIRVVVKRESHIIATSLRPSNIDVGAEAEVKGEQIRLRLEGWNRGWTVHQLEVRAVVYHEDGSYQVNRWQEGRVEPLAEYNFDETFQLNATITDSSVHSVFAEVDWGSGRRVLQAWPLVSGTRFYSRGAFRSGVGTMAALVVLWVGVPMLVRAVQQVRTPSW